MQLDATELATSALESSQTTHTQRQQPSIESTRRDRIAAGLLALFFGLFGIHGFYLGNIVMGLVLIVLFLVAVILTILSVVTFGVALCVCIPFLGAFWLFTFIQAIVYFASSDENFHRRYVIEQRWL